MLRTGTGWMLFNATRLPPTCPLPLLRRRHPKALPPASAFLSGMSSPQRESRVVTKETSEPKKQAERGAPPPLPTPEKPLPGDCCGSGCVRCVWDIYYEELEAYNKSITSDKRDG